MNTKTMKSLILVAVLIMSIALVTNIGSYQEPITNQSNQQTKFVSDDLTIIIPTNNVPFYFFYDTNDDSIAYRVQFDNLFEVNDNDSDQSYSPNDSIVPNSFIALAQMNWSIGEITETEEDGKSVTSFDLTGKGTGFDPTIGDLEIIFANHIISTEEGTELKFDVIINNYEWTNPSEQTLLVLGYKLQEITGEDEGDPAQVSGNETRVEFGQGFFESIPTASNSTGEEVSESVKATLSVGNGDPEGNDNSPRIYIAYTYFEGDLVHDPTIGLSQGQPQDKVFEFDDITIKVPTDQVPFYFFYATDNENETYRLQFDLMFEVKDLNSNGIFDPENETIVPNSILALASMNWELSEIEETSNGVSFNLTGTPLTGDLVVQFRNHIQTVNGETSLKFDVVINNYEWTNDSEDVLLVLAYKLQTTDEPDDLSVSDHEDEESVTFGKGYFNSSTQADSSTGDDVKASLSTGKGSPENGDDNDHRIYISYTHFDGDLVHDPTIGLLSASADSDDQDGTSTPDDEDGTFGGLNFVSLFWVIGSIILLIPVRKVLSQIKR
jgi:hypothetical protein